MMYAIWHTIYEIWSTEKGQALVFESHANAEDWLESVPETVKYRYEIRPVKIVEDK